MKKFHVGVNIIKYIYGELIFGTKLKLSSLYLEESLLKMVKITQKRFNDNLFSSLIKFHILLSFIGNMVCLAQK